ncbi:MAG: hypothetical protein IT361_13130 [Gemmatimonadaceae bacterium]|nr:hypothetical protein [Gemmatimonadaceae bacterium]
MHGSPELLEFYLVEATEYIDALHELVADARGAPDANALLATARALRGSSTMAKVEPIAGLSLVLEDIAVRSHDADFAWTPELHRALRGAVDDLRFAVRGVRVWSDREQSRVDARVADLRRFLPGEGRRATPPSSESTTPVFVALQAAAIAAELDAFVASPEHRRALDDAISRTRTLRGIAGISDFPPLHDVAEAVEHAARRLMPDAPLSHDEVELFGAAAHLFRDAAAQLRRGPTYTPAAADTARIAAATHRTETPPVAAPAVVRIEQLFYADQGPHVVEPPAAPGRPEDRLHQELLSRSEHLQRLIDDARRAVDDVVKRRLQRDLALTVRDIEKLAASFGAHQLAAFFSDAGESGDLLAPSELDSLATAARVTITPFPSLDELERRIAVVTRSRHIAPTSTASVTPPVQVPPTATPRAPQPVAPPTAARSAPTGRALQDLLRTGIEEFRSLDREPLLAPADVDGGEIVEIGTLTFSGPDALARAIALRDDWRSRGGAEDESLREIFDLLDLATSE